MGGIIRGEHHLLSSDFLHRKEAWCPVIGKAESTSEG